MFSQNKRPLWQLLEHRLSNEEQLQQSKQFEINLKQKCKYQPLNINMMQFISNLSLVHSKDIILETLQYHGDLTEILLLKIAIIILSICFCFNVKVRYDLKNTLIIAIFMVFFSFIMMTQSLWFNKETLIYVIYFLNFLYVIFKDKTNNNSTSISEVLIAIILMLQISITEISIFRIISFVLFYTWIFILTINQERNYYPILFFLLILLFAKDTIIRCIFIFQTIFIYLSITFLKYYQKHFRYHAKFWELPQIDIFN